MMGGEEDFVFGSSDSDGADWEKSIGQCHRQRLKQPNPFETSSSSSSSSSSSANSPINDFNTTPSQVTYIPETPEHLIPSKKRTSDVSTNSIALHSKRNCPSPQLLMGNGFRHERVNNSNSNPDSSKTSEMSWQNKRADRNHRANQNHASSSNNQPSGSNQDSSNRLPRYNVRPSRRGLQVLSSDSDDDNDWTEKNSDNTTFQSHSSSPEHSLVQSRPKRVSNNPPRKPRAGYLNRHSRDSAVNNSNISQPSTSQTSKESVPCNGTSRHIHRQKRTTAASNSNSGAQLKSANEEESYTEPSTQTTPKNRHIHRLHMNQNRSSATPVTSYTNNCSNETSFPSNVPFRRDDPGRRAFARSGHPLHGRRSQGSPHHHHHRSPLLRGQDSSFASIVRRNPDLFDSESTDESSELFTVNGNSPGSSFRQTSSPRPRNSFQFQTFVSMTLPENEHENSEGSEDPSVVFVSDSSVSPSSRNRRREHARFTGSSGGRRRRSSRHSHLLTGERDILSSSPDPVAQVNQMEEDERLARLLQAEFDAELSHRHHGNTVGHLSLSESDADVLVDDEEGPSSRSSSSSNNEDTSSGRTRNRLAGQYYMRHQNSSDRSHSSTVEAPVAGLPARGRRRGTRVTNATPNPPVTPPRQHWHGSPVRGRRGRTRTNSDPLMLQFGRWLGWAILRNLEPEEGDDYEVLWNLAESMGDAVPRGLQRHEINRLPTHKYQVASVPDSASAVGTSNRNNNNNSGGTTFTEAAKECRVCLCDYEVNEVLRVLPCFHEFHAVCIDKWLKNNNTCPVCRAEIALDT